MRLVVKLLLVLLPVFAAAKEKPMILLDPGHGGKDTGARVRPLIEKQLTLRTTYIIKRHLEALGYRVILTRARDVYLPLETRVKLANRRSPALFLSIHYNSAAATSARGIEVYYCPRAKERRRIESKKMAEQVIAQMVLETKARSRGVKKANFQVIRETNMPAILIEAGFITHSEERKHLASEAYLEKLGKGIARGIHNYVQANP